MACGILYSVFDIRYVFHCMMFACSNYNVLHLCKCIYFIVKLDCSLVLHALFRYFDLYIDMSFR